MKDKAIKLIKEIIDNRERCFIPELEDNGLNNWTKRAKEFLQEVEEWNI